MKKRISGSIFFTALLTLILTSGLIIPVLYSSFVSETRQALETESGYLVQAMKTLDDVTYLKSVGKDSNTRLTLISPDGTVLYDSNAFESQMENHGNRPEVKAALDTGKGSDSRLSKTLDESTYYYATKLDSGNILRLAITTRSTLGVFGSSASLLAFLLVAVMIAALWVGHSISKAILMPINHLDLDHPLENDTYEELSPLLLRLDRQRQRINEQMQALSDKQREFDQITESMGDGLAIFGSNGHVLSLNRSAKAFFEGGIYNGTYLELCRENPFVGLIETVLQGEKANIRMKRNNRFYELSASPVDAGDGSHAVVLFIADVTERENIEKMRREFSANVSHELKTPLTSILGYSEIMESGLAKPEDINRFAGQIHFEASRLLTLIQDIIRLSSLDESDMSEAFEPIDLYQLCKNVRDSLQKKADKHHVALTLTGAPVTINGIAPTLYEMVFNLCDNAIAYNQDGGTVEIHVGMDYNHPVIWVKDTGIGIPEEHLARIFERFYRVDKSHSKETGGTGLGLSIVKHGAMIHHAEVEVDSTPGEGSTFTITFS